MDEINNVEDMEEIKDDFITVEHVDANLQSLTLSDDQSETNHSSVDELQHKLTSLQISGSNASLEELLLTLELANDAELEDNWVKTSKTLKDIVLLHKRSQCNRFSPPRFDKNAYLYNLATEHFPWIPDKETLAQRLNTIVGGFLTIARFDNVVLAGGSIALALDQRVDLNNLKHHPTDLDFFIYGTHKQTLKDILAYLETRYSVYYLVRSNVIDVFIPGARAIQLVFCKERDPYDVINVFDLGYVKAFFDGESVYASHLAIVALRDQATTCFGPVIESRLKKSEEKGFHVVNKDTITIIPDNPHLVRSRFMVSCLRKEMESCHLSGTPSDVIKTLDREIDWENFKSPRIDSYGHGHIPGKTLVPHYRSVKLGDIVIKKRAFDELYRNLKQFKICLPGGTSERRSDSSELGEQDQDFSVTTNVLRIASKVEPLDPSGAIYLTVHESDFSHFVNEVKSTINRISESDPDLPVIPEKERVYEDQWLKMKIKKDTEILDQFMMPLTRPLQVDDRVFCEVDFKLWGGGCHLRNWRTKKKEFVWERVYLSIYARRVYVI